MIFPSGHRESTGRADWPFASVLDTGDPLIVDEEGVRRALEAMGCEAATPFKSALFLPLGVIGKAGASGVLAAYRSKAS